MAGLPLKSGADFYNLEAARMRLHNLGADPTEVGAGLIYFNTSTGLNTSQKVRLYTGSAWKTIAFSEDLDVAKNEDFLALQRRVDLLSGDVDTDAIISNMKEVSAFLEGFAEDASLMDYLNTELGKKLDLTGGTLYDSSTDTPLKIRGNDTGAFIAFASLYEYFGYIGAKSDKKPYFYVSGKSYEILTSAGGTIEGALTLLGSGTTYLAFAGTDGTAYGSLGISSTHEPKFWNGSGAYTLLHSGNVGDYKAGDADKLGGVPLSRFVYGDNATKTKGISEDAFENPLASGFYAIINASNLPTKTSYNTALHVSYNAENIRAGFDFLIGDYKQSPLYFRPANGDGVGDWKQIAFTDSTVDKARGLGDGYGLSVVSVANSILDLNRNATSGEFYNSANMGLEVECKATEIIFKGYKTDGQLGGRMFLNSSGNVTIGASDLAGSDVRLHIEDTRESSTYLLSARLFSPNLLNGGTSVIVFGKSESNKNRAYIGYTHNSDGSDSNAITFGFYGKDKIVNFLANGNVLIGTNTDNGSGARLQVAGNISLPNNHYIAFSNTAKTPLYQLWMTGNDVFFVGRGSVENGHDSVYCGKTIRFSTGDSAWNNSASIDEEGNFHISGNLIVEGEISGGGRAEEGGTIGGGGAFHSESIAVGATQTTIAHGLGTDDIVVSIYEKDGVSGRWSIILTDVEIVDANNIIVSFGSATSVEHKVVIMGAVA